MADSEQIQIRVSDDELEAWVSLSRRAETRPEALAERLDELGIRAGLDDEAIERLASALANGDACATEVCVARGLPAVQSSPARLLLDDPQGPVPGVPREDGSLDFRQRHLVMPVAAGDSLGRIQPAVQGEAGWNVRGEVIDSHPPTPLDFKYGDGLAVREDGQLIATRDGARAVSREGLIDVVDLYLHPGHVDPTSGNLDSRGSLEIARDVTVEMSVRAANDIKIKGTVDGGRVEAGGSIEILGGAIGRDHGVVIAGGDLRIRHALGIELFAQGLLKVARSVSASKLSAHEVEVDGRVLSESIEAETRISVQEAGSAAGGPCFLRVAHPLDPKGFDPSLRPAAVGRSTPARGPGKGNTSQGTTGSARMSRKGRGQTNKRVEPEVDLDVRLDWRRRQRALQRNAMIEIRGTGHAGCRIDFGGKLLTLEEDVQSVRYRLDAESDEIVAVEYKK